MVPGTRADPAAIGPYTSLDSTAELTASGVVLGTPGWLAPERLLRGVADPAADVFTWGCLVAYAGMGRHPYGTGDPVAMAGRVIHGEPELDGLPGPLARSSARPSTRTRPPGPPPASSCSRSPAAPGPASPPPRSPMRWASRGAARAHGCSSAG